MSLKKALSSLILGLAITSPTMALDKPKLVVILVVDQMHPELLARYQAGLAADGGFSRFIQNSLRYPEAYVDHFLTLTGPGHASISTGATPSQHGIVGNYWYDKASGGMTASVSDSAYPVIGIEDWSVAPTKLAARTLADQLELSTNDTAKVVTVSGKDRGSALIAGQKGMAFWYATQTGGFVTSTYYMPDLPRWVKRFNRKESADSYENTWRLLHPPRRYTPADDRSSERPYSPMGTTFPHPLGELGSAEYYANVKRVPIVDDMTLKFALRAVEHEKLGDDAVPDLLSISLSATDYVGHDFGPYSRESEDNLYRLDQALGQFMDNLEAKVSSRDILYVMTADHGVDASPEFRQQQGLVGHRLDVPALTEALNKHLASVFETEGILVNAALHTGVYFNTELLERLPKQEVYLETKRWLEGQEAIDYALILPDEKIPDAHYNRLVQNTLYYGRMGKIFIVPAYGTFFGYPSNAATHGTPYQYDRHIPLMFLTGNRKASVHFTNATQRSIAPTLAAILEITKPSQATAPPLVAVVEEYND